MLIRSTGLGRTLLSCDVVKIEVTDIIPSTLEPSKDSHKEPMRILMTIQTTHPVTWTVRGFVEPDDLRLILKAALKPSVILATIKFLLFGNRHLDRHRHRSNHKPECEQGRSTGI